VLFLGTNKLMMGECVNGAGPFIWKGSTLELKKTTITATGCLMQAGEFLWEAHLGMF